MKAKEQIIQELNHLNRLEILKVYNLISALKSNMPQGDKGKRSRRFSTAYLRAREALKNCKGSLADDIIAEREDRV
jgi:hypothetical protein